VVSPQAQPTEALEVEPAPIVESKQEIAAPDSAKQEVSNNQPVVESEPKSLELSRQKTTSCIAPGSGSNLEEVPLTRRQTINPFKNKL
jgi:hypothetical protein